MKRYCKAVRNYNDHNGQAAKSHEVLVAERTLCAVRARASRESTRCSKIEVNAIGAVTLDCA
jgi:hypothetical protein